MWRVYLLEAVVALTISIVWTYLISKNMDNTDNDDMEFP